MDTLRRAGGRAGLRLFRLGFPLQLSLSLSSALAFFSHQPPPPPPPLGTQRLLPPPHRQKKNKKEVDESLSLSLMAPPHAFLLLPDCTEEGKRLLPQLGRHERNRDFEDSCRGTGQSLNPSLPP